MKLKLKMFNLCCLLSLGMQVLYAQDQGKNIQRQSGLSASLPIIPAPVGFTFQKGVFFIKPTTTFLLDKSIQTDNVLFFNQYLEGLVGFKIKSAASEGKNTIYLKLDPLKIPQNEGYQLRITSEAITITGHDEAGVFYGLQSLVQLLKKQGAGLAGIPAVNITDYPRFGYRGMHLDVSRNMFPVSAIKKWIDLLALYKINTFHWHLTDDQGWRIEIKKYPKLQTVSSIRSETIIGHKRSEPHRFDGKPYGGYYTQEEAKEIVKYAMARHITVIPEIEMPGHAQAALSAYPNLGCSGGPYMTATYWGVFENVFCAGKEETFNFLEDVLDEVLVLFPSSYIHIGGDECPKTQWKICLLCQKRIKDENLKDEHELQSYFISRIEKYLASKGRKIIGWDEILEGGLAPSATVMSWRGLEGGIAAAKLNHDVIMTPEKYVYLDYYQSLYQGEQIAAGGYTSLSKVYGYEPVPEELTPEQAKYIKGVQANAWSEYLDNPAKAEYMLFPRMFALAEIAWSKKSLRNYPEFLKRLRLQDVMLKQLKVNYFRDFDEINGTETIRNGKVELSLHSDLPNAVIRYNTNGETPDSRSTKYLKPILISKNSQVRAIIFNTKTVTKRVYKQDFVINKATGKPLNLISKPSGNFAPANELSLVNGIKGNELYNDGEWTGFSGENLEVIIDLQQPTIISHVGINILKYHWQKMWAPDLLKFEISLDGEHFTEAYKQTEFPAEGINVINATINPIKTRYVRVTAINKGIIPAGEYGAGGKAWLLTDEIFLN